MATFTLDTDKAQAAMNAIGAAYFPLERLIKASGDAEMQLLNTTLHQALAAGEKLVIDAAGGGTVKPQEGGDKPPPNS